MRILVVCSGNICRSPMVAGALRCEADAAGARELQVDSAGTLGIEGRPAAREAITVCADAGIELAGHRSQGIRATLMHQADVVLGMTVDHLEELARRFPDGAAHRYLLRAFEKGPRPADEAPDLVDPIGLPIETYRQQLPIVQTCVRNLVAYLKHGPPDS